MQNNKVPYMQNGGIFFTANHINNDIHIKSGILHSVYTMYSHVWFYIQIDGVIFDTESIIEYTVIPLENPKNCKFTYCYCLLCAIHCR